MGVGTRLAKRFVESLRSNGTSTTLRLCAKTLAHEARSYLDRRFDRRFGVDTSGRVDLAGLSIGSPNAELGVYYEPTSVLAFRSLIRRLAFPPSGWTFLDIGSGKGRTLFLAADYPFRKIIGVEFAKDLHDIAVMNAERYRSPSQQCAVFELNHMDAVDFKMPQEPLVVFLFNPFERPVMERVARNAAEAIKASGQDMVVIYHNALKREIFESLGCFPEVVPVKLPYDFTREHQRPAVIFSTRPGLVQRDISQTSK